jgi:hypothetical protein
MRIHDVLDIAAQRRKGRPKLFRKQWQYLSLRVVAFLKFLGGLPVGIYYRIEAI